jgi:uncharacterized protein (TIGR02270 family)
VRQPVGVRPWETSALTNKDIVFQHASETAFLWTLRTSAIRAPNYSLNDLSKLDGRVEAHLDGLRGAGRLGWDLCQANLANDGPGEVFALSILAFHDGESAKMRDAVNAGCASPRVWPGLVSALGWLEFERVSRWLDLLVNARSPLHRSVGIAAYAIHRRDPGPALTSSIEDQDAFLRARALRAVGELKRRDLANHLQAHLEDTNDKCRFWAAWSLTLLGEPGGIPTLLGFANSGGGDLAVPALQAGLRALSPADSRRWLSAFAAAEPDRVRLTIFGAGIIGDPTSVPWLIKKMDSPASARLAGEAFTMITGIDLAYHDLDRDAPSMPEDESTESEDVPGGMAYENGLPRPSAILVADWWERHHSTFITGTRYLSGQPISAQSAMDVLMRGTQRQRKAAALEIALLDPTTEFWEVRTRGRRQRELLSTLTPSTRA